MIDKVMQIIAPHYCYGCAKVGTPLCDNCKYDIVDEMVDACLVCQSPTLTGICERCRTSYDRAWHMGERSETLERVINGLKFERNQAAAQSLAELMSQRLPSLPSNVQLVPVPTIPRHVRQRGYDHTLLIARQLGRLRGLKVAPLLGRSTSFVQLGKTKRERFTQAEQTFSCIKKVDPDVIYLIIDDVVTTNATVRFAAAALKNAGAETVWVAVVARQALGGHEKTT